MAVERNRKNVQSKRTLVTADYARAALGEVIDRVAYENETIVITRHGKPLVEMRKVERPGAAGAAA